MLANIKLADNIHYIGVNDRRTHLFENYWPLPYGVSYNAYLIDDEKVALIDTVEIGYVEDYLSHIKTLLNGRKVDYLIVNHMEPDHSGSIRALVNAYPEVTIVGNSKTRPMLEGFYGITEHYHEVKDGDTLNLGKHTLNFYMTPMVHWPENMVTFESETAILFSNDSFGSFGTLDGGVFDDEVNIEFFREEMRRYYSNIVGKYGAQVQKALKKLSGLSIKQIAPAHGPIWRSHLDVVIGLYDKWSKCETEEGVVIVYGSLYGNTERMAEIIARAVSEAGIKNIRIYDASKTHTSYIISDIWKYRGVILGSSAYNGGLFTPMKGLVGELEHIMPKNHKLGIFGSMSWGGGGVRKLKEFAENIKWDLVAEPVEVKHAASALDIPNLIAIGKAMANAVKENI